MTEAEWLAADDVSDMTRQLSDRNVTERKCHLFAFECVRAIQDHLRDKRSLAAFEFFETNAEELFSKPVDKNLRRRRRRVEQAAAAVAEATEVILRAAEQRASEPNGYFHPDEWYRIRLAASAAAAARWLLYAPPSSVAMLCARYTEEAVAAPAEIPFQPETQCKNYWQGYERQRRLNATWFRDIFGNPFRPVSFSPEWRTSTAISLAKGMYNSRDFSAMPILADALQDAGCNSEDILDHCRDANGVHVRGCWVVDLILGKK